jgi:hypothetical protein
MSPSCDHAVGSIKLNVAMLKASSPGPCFVDVVIEAGVDGEGVEML